MAAAEPLPRLFGSYLLTEKTGGDALGKTYRARKAANPKSFHALRILDAPGLDAEPVFTAIEQNGAVHDFLKNPAIVREVELDSVEGDPYMAYLEPGGRTLDRLIAVSLSRPFPIPVEHSLLICEKIATGLDHAYNTKIDGERTLHGLLWPGFVEISDEGETRLSGFGLAEGILASKGASPIAQLLFPFLAPEVRASGKPSKAGDVYSTASILFLMLTGIAPPLDNAASALSSVKLFRQTQPIPEDVASVLKTALSASPDARYETAGALRRDIGKLLFSGTYSPSTFNLAFFLNNLLKEEIAREQALRHEEEGLDANKYPRHVPSVPRAPRPVVTPRFGASPFDEGESRPAPAAKKSSPLIFIVIAGVVVAAGAAFFFLRGGKGQPAPAPRPAPVPVAASAPSVVSASTATAPPTGVMTPEQYKEEVAARVTGELKKIEENQKAKQAKAAAASAATLKPQPAPVTPAITTPKPISPPPASSAPASSEPFPAPVPTATSPVSSAPPASPAVKRGDLVDISEVDTKPEIATIVKPGYPPVAKQMNVSGTVILQVLVNENGKAADVRVIREAGGKMGLNDAAISAVKKWTFRAATKDGVQVKTWFTIPIPFVL